MENYQILFTTSVCESLLLHDYASLGLPKGSGTAKLKTPSRFNTTSCNTIDLESAMLPVRYSYREKLYRCRSA